MTESAMRERLDYMKLRQTEQAIREVAGRYNAMIADVMNRSTFKMICRKGEMPETVYPESTLEIIAGIEKLRDELIASEIRRLENA